MPLIDLRESKLVAVVGLGYVGLPLAIEFASKYAVIGFDLNKARIRSLSEGFDETNEVPSAKLAQTQNISFTSDVCDIMDASVYVVTVPTPINVAKEPDLSLLMKASEMVGKCLSPQDVVIFESTVFPGATEDICIPILEQASGLKCNTEEASDADRGFFVGYSPERINPGDRKHTLTSVVKVTSGSTAEAARAIDDLYKSIVTAGTHLAPSIKVAEAAKVIENTQRDLNIAFVNELSIIFNKLNIDTQDVLRAAETKWNFASFRPGLVGGHCIGVDPYYLTHKAKSVGLHPEVILAGRRMNDGMASQVANQIIKILSRVGKPINSMRVGVLGVTFKANCPDTRNTKVVDLIDELKSWEVEMIIVDPLVPQDKSVSGNGIVLDNLDDLSNLDAVILAVAHDVFAEIDLQDIVGMMRHPETGFVFDIPGGLTKSEVIEAGLAYFRL